MALFEEQFAKKDEYIYHRTEKNPNSGIRFHNAFEFLYVCSGRIEMNVDGKLCVLQAGEAALVFPDIVHSYRSLGEAQSYTCIFSDACVPEFGKRRRLTAPESYSFSLPGGAEITRLLQSSGNTLAIKGILYYLLSFVSDDGDDGSGGEIIAVAQQVMDYIEQNYSESITLKDISAALNYNYNYLSALINRIFKMSFSKLLNKYRVYTAEQLLKEKKYKIIDISERCGYSSLRSFNRNFKKITGKTPSEYLMANGGI